MKQEVCPICMKVLKNSYCDDCGMSFKEEQDITNPEAVYAVAERHAARPSSMQRQMYGQTGYSAPIRTQSIPASEDGKGKLVPADIVTIIVLFLFCAPIGILYLAYKLYKSAQGGKSDKEMK